VRDGFKAALLKRAQCDNTFQVLTGDHGYALFDEFEAAFPDRFHNVGIAESNLIGLAAGMARNGLTPLVYGLAAFIPNRVFEFIKLQIAAENLPITMVGDGAGLVYSTLGISHQTLEDLAIIGSLPSVHSLAPASNEEMEIAVRWAGKSRLPTYIRMGKSDGVFQGASSASEPSPYLVHKAQPSSPKAIIAHGSMVSSAMELLKTSLQSFDVWSCPTVSPMHPSFLVDLNTRYDHLVVLEEHGVHGGLGSRIIQSMANNGLTIHLIGAELQEERTVGSWNWALHIHGLSPERLTLKLREIGFLV
jgi:transketolase